MSTISVLILMGSDSDAPVMQAAVEVLREFDIPCEMTVASAHRSPERVMRLVAEAPGRGVRLFIVGAGRRGPSRRRCRSAHDAAGHRRANRLLGAERDGRAAVDRPDAAGRAGGHRVDRQAWRDKRGCARGADAGVADRVAGRKVDRYKKKLADKVEQAAATAADRREVHYASSRSGAGSTRPTRCGWKRISAPAAALSRPRALPTW